MMPGFLRDRFRKHVLCLSIAAAVTIPLLGGSVAEARGTQSHTRPRAQHFDQRAVRRRQTGMQDADSSFAGYVLFGVIALGTAAFIARAAMKDASGASGASGERRIFTAAIAVGASAAREAEGALRLFEHDSSGAPTELAYQRMQAVVDTLCRRDGDWRRAAIVDDARVAASKEAEAFARASDSMRNRRPGEGRRGAGMPEGGRDHEGLAVVTLIVALDAAEAGAPADARALLALLQTIERSAVTAFEAHFSPTPSNEALSEPELDALFPELAAHARG